MSGMIERAVRRTVVGSREHTRLRACRTESDELLQNVSLVDKRLALAEAARVAAETGRDRAIWELERILHLIPALLIFKQFDGTLMRVSQNTAHAFGLTPGEMVGKNQDDFWPSEQVAKFKADDEEIMRTGEGKHGYLETVRWKGEDHMFRTWKIPIYNGEPVPIGVMLFAVDVTLVGDLSVEILGAFEMTSMVSNRHGTAQKKGDHT